MAKKQNEKEEDDSDKLKNLMKEIYVDALNTQGNE